MFTKLIIFVSNFFRRLTHAVREKMFGHKVVAAVGRSVLASYLGQCFCTVSRLLLTSPMSQRVGYGRRVFLVGASSRRPQGRGTGLVSNFFRRRACGIGLLAKAPEGKR